MCNLARPSQQQLSSCFSVLYARNYLVFELQFSIGNGCKVWTSKLCKKNINSGPKQFYWFWQTSAVTGERYTTSTHGVLKEHDLTAAYWLQTARIIHCRGCQPRYQQQHQPWLLSHHLASFIPHPFFSRHVVSLAIRITASLGLRHARFKTTRLFAEDLIERLETAAWILHN